MNLDVFQPKFKRVRTVKYINGGYTCSCHGYTVSGIQCRHICAIGVPPGPYSCHVKYWKSYNNDIKHKIW